MLLLIADMIIGADCFIYVYCATEFSDVLITSQKSMYVMQPVTRFAVVVSGLIVCLSACAFASLNQVLFDIGKSLNSCWFYVL